MKILKKLIFLIVGFVVGFFFMLYLRNSNPSLVEITFSNESSLVLSKIVVHDYKLGNNYLIENLKPNDSALINIYVNGEIGFNIISVFENGDTLFSGGYAESGYKDIYAVKNDSIIYKHKNY